MFGKKKEKATYVPSLGTAEQFKNEYKDEHLVIGVSAGNKVYIGANQTPCNNVVVINDNQRSVERQCVIPLIEQGELSYVVYDPNGTYRESLESKMKSIGYDVQLIDFDCEENMSRVDIFEVANMIKNPYWASVILSGSMKCTKEEVAPVHNLFMAIMQYLLAANKKVNIVDMYALFKKIQSNDQGLLLDMIHCAASSKYVNKFNECDEEMKASVCKKLTDRFFKTAWNKCVNPNVFTVTTHKQKTITFVRRVPQKYQYIITMLLFNLMASRVISGEKSLNTVIIDPSNETWYNKELLNNVCKESNGVLSNGVIRVNVKSVVDELSEDSLYLYMHADDEHTKKIIMENLTVDRQTTDQEKREISVKFYRKKPLPNDVLAMTPLTVEELDKLRHCLVIDPTYKTKAFMCERLA